MTSSERRKFPRTPEAFTVKYRVTGDLAATWQSITTVNISAGGLRFRVAEPLERGTPVQFEIKFPGLSQAMILQGLVIWSELQASGVMEVGAEFHDVKLHERAMIDRLVWFLRARF